MNQQKNYHRTLKITRLLTKHITMILFFFLILSFLSTSIFSHITTAASILQDGGAEIKGAGGDTTPEKTDKISTDTEESPQTKDQSPAIKDDSTSNPDVGKNDQDQKSSNSDTSSADETTTKQETASEGALVQNKNDTISMIGTNNTSIVNNIIFIDKTTIIKNTDANQESSSMQTKENIDLHLEGNIGTVIKDSQISIKTNHTMTKPSFISQVDFTASKTHENVTLTVTELKEKPEEVQTPPHLSMNYKIYKYVDIKLTSNDTYIGETGIATMNFTFTIDKEWIETNNLDKDTIVMLRYHNETWASLNTTFINESEEFLYFKAETPGLSVFAVVGDTIVEDSDAIVDGSTQIPIWVSLGMIASSSTLLGIVLVKKRFIYRR